MTSNRFSIDDLMILDAECDPVQKIYIRQILDYGSSEFQNSKLSPQKKVDIINALGLEALTKVLGECFRRTGNTENAEDRAQLAWQMMSGNKFLGVAVSEE